MLTLSSSDARLAHRFDSSFDRAMSKQTAVHALAASSLHNVEFAVLQLRSICVVSAATAAVWRGSHQPGGDSHIASSSRTGIMSSIK